MTEKEFRKLKAKDLVQLLLTQGGEASRLQGQIDEKGNELVKLLEDNDALKVKLDDSDAYIENLKKDLDERDHLIRKLEAEYESLRNDLWIDMPEIGALTEAIKLLDEIFETAQREADLHIKYAKEQGINPNKVRVARPAMPVTVMPASSASAAAAKQSGTASSSLTEVAPEPKASQARLAAVEAEPAKRKDPASLAPDFVEGSMDEEEGALESCISSPEAEKSQEAVAAIDRFAAESKAAFESEQPVSALDRLSAPKNTAPNGEADQPPKLSKAIAAAAAAIGETESASSVASGETEPEPFATQPHASAASPEEKEHSKQRRRKGLFGFIKSGKDKSKRDMDRYESSPMVARMKN